jgi:hypothetical protein
VRTCALRPTRWLLNHGSAAALTTAQIVALDTGDIIALSTAQVAP